MSLLSKRNPQLVQGDGDGDGDDVVDTQSELVVSRTKKRRVNRHQIGAEEVKEMKKLEGFLFGSLEPVEFGKDDDDKYLAGSDKDDDDEENSSATFFLDKSASDMSPAYLEDAELLSIQGKDEEETKQRKAVWVDEEEEKIQINIAEVNRLRKLRKEEGENFISGSDYVARLRAQHAKLNRGTEWARQDPKMRSNGFSDDESSDEKDGIVVTHHEDNEALDNVLRTNEDLVVKSKEKLLPGLLEYSGLAEVTREDFSDSPITSVQFHRNAQLLLTAGLDRRLRFFQIDGKHNTKIESIFFDDCSIRKASFLPDGTQVIVAGRRKFFYSLDVVEAKVDKIGPLVGREEKSLEVFEVSPDSSTIAFVGNEGYILLVSTRTKELIGTLKMNGTARSLAFADGGRHLLSHGGDGHVYHWDLRTRACIHRAVDYGCISGTAICTSPDSKLFATGSDSGVVNVYSREKFLGGNRKPIKMIENLTSKVDFMKFNSDAQILAICSHMKKSSLKLIHVPSFTAFSNWPSVRRNPNNQTGIPSYPRCLDFSPGGGFMAVGDAAGKVLLYKLHHYHHA